VIQKQGEYYHKWTRHEKKFLRIRWEIARSRTYWPPCN
jgi:hypothetical protein